MLDNFREIYNRELEHCDSQFEKMILSSQEVRMFVYEICKACRASNKRFAEGFKKGQESVRRQNKSGCCCIIDDNDKIVSVCGAHAEWAENLIRNVFKEQRA